MKKSFTVLLIVLLSSFTFSQILDQQYFQKNYEVYFKFNISDRTEIELLTRIISIDNVIGNQVIAYANKKEFDSFLRLGIPFEIIDVRKERNGIRHGSPYQHDPRTGSARPLQQGNLWQIRYRHRRHCWEGTRVHRHLSGNS